MGRFNFTLKSIPRDSHYREVWAACDSAETNLGDFFLGEMSWKRRSLHQVSNPSMMSATR